jgi:hypothetical protein
LKGKEQHMRDSLPLQSNHNLPDPLPEEEQAVPEPVVDVVWNVYTEKGDAKSMALKVSLRLPVKS